MPSSEPVSSRAFASGSAALIRAPPIRTASTPDPLQLLELGPRGDAALGDDGLARRHVGHQLVGGRDVDRALVEVAVVDPDHVGIELQGPLELALVVDLDQAVEVEAARLGIKISAARSRRAAPTISRTASAPLTAAS